VRRIGFEQEAFAEFFEWGKIDKKLQQKIVKLIEETLRSPFEGTGKPKPLKHYHQGYWSRRISEEHRLVYNITDDELIIISCKGHYEK
jgi:toxin YoeB